MIEASGGFQAKLITEFTKWRKVNMVELEENEIETSVEAYIYFLEAKLEEERNKAEVYEDMHDYEQKYYTACEQLKTLENNFSALRVKFNKEMVALKTKIGKLEAERDQLIDEVIKPGGKHGA